MNMKLLVSNDPMNFKDRPPKYIFIDGTVIEINECIAREREQSILGWNYNINNGHTRRSFALLCAYDNVTVLDVTSDVVLFLDVPIGTFMKPLIDSWIAVNKFNPNLLADVDKAH